MPMVSPSSASGAADTLRPFGLGFRPFFLLAGLSGGLLIAAWLGIWQGHLVMPAVPEIIAWHSHEMLFGYAVAVIAGFLLTATRNWTGRMTLHGTPLAMLALLWLAGRIAPWLPGVPMSIAALLDVAFLPLLALSLAPALLGGKVLSNKLLIPLLLAMAAANALVWAQTLGWTSNTGAMGIELMLYLVVWLLLFMAGRVVPFFIEKAVPASQPRHFVWLEKSWPWLMLTWLLMLLSGVNGTPAAVMIFILAALHGVRLAGWHHPGIWRNPMLWVLVSGYAWMVLGLVLMASHEAGWLIRSTAVHALTAGGIGILTLGMMARVSLGHTGRAMQPQRLTVISFWLINLAAALRVFGPWWLPAQHSLWISLAGLTWLLAFAAFVWVYLPVLLRARVDGRAD